MPRLANVPRVLAGAIISMARELYIRVVTQGVETKAQFSSCANIAATPCGGVYFSRPERPDVIRGMLGE